MRLLDGHVGRNRYSYLHELILSSSKTIYVYTHIVFIEVNTDLYMAWKYSIYNKENSCTYDKIALEDNDTVR